MYFDSIIEASAVQANPFGPRNRHDFRFAFKDGRFVYFLFSRTLGLQDNKNFTFIARMCEEDQSYYSYTELQLNCSSNRKYNKALVKRKKKFYKIFKTFQSFLQKTSSVSHRLLLLELLVTFWPKTWQSPVSMEQFWGPTGCCLSPSAQRRKQRQPCVRTVCFFKLAECQIESNELPFHLRISSWKSFKKANLISCSREITISHDSYQRAFSALNFDLIGWKERKKDHPKKVCVKSMV